MTTVVATKEVPSRHRADVFDLRVEGPKETHGVGFGNEYIGGCSGIGWWEYFRDMKTGEVYKVHCSDGVNGGNDSYTDKDMMYRRRCFDAIVARTHAETKTGQTVIYVSKNEWIIMDNHAHYSWLESAEGKRDGEQSKENALEGGFIGMCRGIPVVCDLKRKDMLPPRE